MFLDIGFSVFDEFHHLNSEVFSRALPKLSCKFMLGLSATPKRDDGLDKIGEYYLGSTIFSLELENDSDVKVSIYVYKPPKERS
jgi:superfamily II DNA or RNA helicase